MTSFIHWEVSAVFVLCYAMLCAANKTVGYGNSSRPDQAGIAGGALTDPCTHLRSINAVGRAIRGNNFWEATWLDSLYP